MAVGSQRQTALQQKEPQGKIDLLLFVACKKHFDFPTVHLQFCYIHPYFVLCGTSSALWLLSDVGRVLCFFFFFFHSCVNAERLV